MSEGIQFILFAIFWAWFCCQVSVWIDKLCAHFAVIDRIVKRIA